MKKKKILVKPATTKNAKGVVLYESGGIGSCCYYPPGGFYMCSDPWC